MLNHLLFKHLPELCRPPACRPPERSLTAASLCPSTAATHEGMPQGHSSNFYFLKLSSLLSQKVIFVKEGSLMDAFKQVQQKGRN